MKKAKSKPTNKPRSIFVRASSTEDLKLINDLEKETGEKTSSGAFMSAGKNYLQQKKELVKNRDEILDLKKQIQTANEILYRLSSANETFEAYCKKFIK